MAFVNVAPVVQMGAGYESPAAYQTAVTVDNKIPFKSENILPDPQFSEDEALTGHAGKRAMDLMFEQFGGAIPCHLSYDNKASSDFFGTDLFIALAMGQAAYANSVNLMKLIDDLNVFGTIAIGKGDAGASKLWEWISCYFNGMTISGSKGNTIEASFDILPYDLALASTNSLTDITGLDDTMPARANFNDITFRFNTVVGGLLDATDNLTINDFTLSLNNNLTPPEQGTIDAGHLDANLTIQPKRNGFRDCSFNFTLPRYESDTLFNTVMNAETDMQGQLIFTGPGTDTITVYMPFMRMTKADPPIGGPEIITQSVECTLLRGADALSGAGNAAMVSIYDAAAIVDEFAIETNNDRTATPLA